MSQRAPRLSLSHSTIAVRDMPEMVAFYCDLLGFHVTNRGEVGEGAEAVFLCQDPTQHHQIVMMSGVEAPEHSFVMVDHLAFRTDSLDSLRVIGARLAGAGVQGVIPVSHGNAWSLYFNDPEGNGLECFVDTPFHVAQPHAGPLDLEATDDEIEATTRNEIEGLPEFASFDEWRAAFAEKLERTAGN